MSTREFSIDPESSSIADSVVAALRQRQEEVIHRPGVVRRGLLGPQLAAGTAPLNDIPGGVPVEDLREDIHDFGALLAFTTTVSQSRTILALRLGQELLPVLPRHDLLNTLLRRKFPRLDIVKKVYSASRTPAVPNIDELTFVPFPEAQDAFFRGLSTYLAARIAGFAWLRSRRQRNLAAEAEESAEAEEAEGGGGAEEDQGGVFGMQVGSRGAGGSGRAGQWWTAHTQVPGLTLYYAGTHAVRNPPNKLGGFTTPVKIFLPLGTLYLAADAGPQGAIKWDLSVVTVPSHQPIFTTKVF